MSSAQKVLLTLADLAPSAEGRTTSTAIPTEWFRWLPLEAVRLFVPPAEGGVTAADHSACAGRD